MKWIALAMIIVPLTDMATRYHNGKTFRELRKRTDIPYIQVIIDQTKQFYEPQWYHWFSPAIGLVLLIGAIL